MAILPLVLFYLLSFLPLCFFLKPVSVALHQWLQPHSTLPPGKQNEQELSAPFPIIPLATATGIGVFLLLFSLIGRVIDSYFVIVPLCYLVMGAGIFLAFRFLEPLKSIGNWTKEQIRFDLKASLPFVFFFFLLHLSLWFGRSFFSDIHFDPNHFGAEKLFNYHFQQSYLFGGGYPPPDVWLAGERVSYYALPKALAGLASFFTRALSGNPFSGGLLFHFIDTFYVALSSTVLASCAYLFLTKSGNKKAWGVTFFSFFVGLIPLLSAPARALKQSAAGNIDLWSLTRIIDNTINEYPFWNYLWADNHAHSAVLFMQLTFMVWVLAYLTAENWKNPLLFVFCAGLAPVILMSHSGSVLIDLVVLGTLAAVALIVKIRNKTQKDFLLTSVNLGAAIFVLAAPDYFMRGQPHVKWYFVPRELSSTFVEFLNINLFVLGFLASLLLLVLPMAIRAKKDPSKTTDVGLGVHFGLCVLAMGAGYPAVGVPLFLIGLAIFLLERAEEAKMSVLRKFCLYAAMLMWVFPELIASNFDMGDKYMRYNSLFRFLFESFYVIPLFWTFAFAPTISLALQKTKSKIVYVALACMAAVVFGAVQFKTFQNRVERVATTSSFDGTAFLKTERPTDWAIIEFVAHLAGPVVLAEECGMQPKPTAYSVAGRISAYSGRPALCGWSTHTQQFQDTMKYGPFKGAGVWDQLIKRNDWITQVLSMSSEKSLTDPALQSALHNLHSVGVTHIIFGEWEKQLHPQVQLASLARLGHVVFEQNGMGVIELNQQ